MSRRRALTGVMGVGLGVPLVAACGAETTTASDKAVPKGSPFAATTDIPVGGGTIYADESVVVTQPTAGVFKGFSNICTHQGCPVGSVSGGKIECPCHGSEYSITDGSVEGGPAPSPLPAVAIKVTGSKISLA